MGKRKPIRICALSDMHSGATFGLTHHSLLARPSKDAPPEELEVYKGRKEIQTAYYDLVRENGPFDHAFVVGDLVEGPGEKDYGTEVLRIDPAWQKDNAVALLRRLGVKDENFLFVQGTRYHGKRWGNMEQDIAGRFGHKLYRHPFINVGGVWFDVRHKVGRSGIPHGKLTPTARARMWNVLLSARGRQPKARVIVRAHVHEHNFCGSAEEWLAVTLPGLQGPSAYGDLEVDGSVDFGFVVFEIHPGGKIKWHAAIKELDVLKSSQVILQQ